jgi:alkaline phosphatase
MDDLLGAMLDIDDSVSEIMDWIGKNGGYEKNALYVTADHDHYLTLLPRKCDLRIHFILLRISNAQSCLISSSTD